MIFLHSLTENGCVWEEGFCWGDEKCKGSEISSTCVGGVTTAYATVLERPDINDPSTPGEDWFCIRYEFDIAAAPGDYNFNLDVNPDI
jgi:hypothetical protein